MVALDEMRSRAADFADRLDRVKAEIDPPPWGWYPFPMLPAFVEVLDGLLSGEHRRLLEAPTERRVADIGAADGDFAFFLESLGFAVDVYEGGADDIRNLRMLPATTLKRALGSGVEIYGVDLDREFALQHTYELAFCLGVLYHLKNPFQLLETLARQARHCVISTKIARWLPRQGRLRSRLDMTSAPVAYLLDPYEASPDDASNYWVFSEAGLARLLKRSGWTVLDYTTTGDPATAEPAGPDWRAWCLLRSEVLCQPRRGG